MESKLFNSVSFDTFYSTLTEKPLVTTPTTHKHHLSRYTYMLVLGCGVSIAVSFPTLLK